MAGRVDLRVRRARVVSTLAAVALAVSAAAADRPRLVPVQADDKAKQLGAGKILVARRSLADPNFAETVVLLVQYDEDGTLGLIINRQTKVPVSRLWKEIQAARGRTEPLYVGGPVATSGLMALLRTGIKPDEAQHVFADVYMISSKTAVEKAVGSSADAKTLRLYMGYAGWDGGQLEWEMGMDAWDVLPAKSGIVFDPHPETLWSRLVEQEGMQMAGLRPERLLFWRLPWSLHAAD